MWKMKQEAEHGEEPLSSRHDNSPRPLEPSNFKQVELTVP